VGKGFDTINVILLLGSVLSNSISFNILFDIINLINVPGNSWEGNLTSGSAGNEGSDSSEFHILKNWFY
jgi:hypothetical protein